MSKREYGIVIVVAAAAGLVGGGISGRLFTVGSVFAQETSRRFQVIEAEEFRLVERDGKPCGRFHVDRNGRPALFLFDKHGEVRAVLGVTPSGSPHLALSDKDGKVRATLAVWTDEQAGLFLADKKETSRAVLTVPADDNPNLAISDRDGKIRAVFGSASFELVPTKDLRNRSESSLALLDKQGKVLWSAP